MGARVLGLPPIVPLLPGGGPGVALFRSEGKLSWGFDADYELVPNLARRAPPAIARAWYNRPR